MRRWLLLALVGACASPANADELRLDAKALYERSITRDVRLAAGGAAIELEEGELFEDDGPAAGFSYKPNEERLSDKLWVKKELWRRHLAAKGIAIEKEVTWPRRALILLPRPRRQRGRTGHARRLGTPANW